MGRPGPSAAAGAATVTRTAQRVPQETDSEVPPGLQGSRLSELDEFLDRFNTPEDELITLLGEMDGSDKRAVISRYRDRLADVLDVGEMKRAVVNLDAPLRVALDWIDAAALVTRAIDYVEIQSLVTAASQPERDAVATNHYRDFFVKVCTNNTMIAALRDLRFPWATARRWAREEGIETLDLARALASAGVVSVAGLTSFLAAAARGAGAARAHLRNLSDGALAELHASPVPADVIRDTFGSGASPVLRVLNGEISSGEANVTTSEDLLAGPTTGPFTSMHFGGDNRFNVAYRRDRVNVSVGVELTAVDDRARELLPAAKQIWLRRIRAAWGNRFRLANGQRTIPLRFLVNLDSGPNHVNIHSGVWAWPEPQCRQLVRARPRKRPPAGGGRVAGACPRVRPPDRQCRRVQPDRGALRPGDRTARDQCRHGSGDRHEGSHAVHELAEPDGLGFHRGTAPHRQHPRLGERQPSCGRARVPRRDLGGAA